MKKIMFFVFALSAIVLTSACSSASDDEMFAQAEQPAVDEYVTISFSPYFVEAMTRGAGDKAVSEVCDRLDIWISDGETTTEYHQQKTDTGFGSLSVQLNKTKTYTLYAVGHKSPSAVTMSSNLISFADNLVFDAFYCKKVFTPSASLECQLTRFVGQFSLWITDAIPEETVKMHFIISASNTQWNVSTGVGATPLVRTRDFTSWSSLGDGSTMFNINVIPDNLTDITTVDITVQALDENDDIIEERSFADVNIKASYRSIYKGTFFITTDMAYSFVLNDSWTQDVTNF